ncbi:hypothetical protein [Leptolyngbya sp. FACHB-17]|uniref:hypothetical protein n=1 Tax=unclassified Leptolyngbya TaxID=2650499 RepID=UPI001F558FB7|nr:hypothetical protein [Leptolyngbya sp. FACHB-17]
MSPKRNSSLPNMTRRILAPLASLLLTLTTAIAPAQSLTVPIATSEARIRQRQEQLNLITPAAYDLTRYPVVDSNETHWRKLLWATAVIEPQDTYIRETIAQILTLTPQNLTPAQARTVEMALQVGTQLYLSKPTPNLQQQFIQTIAQSSNPRWVAMSLSALAKSGTSVTEQQQLINFIAQRFPRWSENVSLYTTITELTAPTRIPPIRDLLVWTIVPNQQQLYVFCNRDRSQLCSAFLKDQRGRFVRENGRLWTMPLLTRSLHNLSWNFSRGYTPQGIYRIEGTIPQPDTDFFRAYGFYSLVQLFAPLEPGVKEFIPGRKGTLAGKLDGYNALLPPSWRSYFPIQASYWAGMAGRNLFRIHGSGENPSFFTNNQRYLQSRGWNPAIGCLSALELYDSNGRLRSAHMPGLLNKLGAKPTGYLIVVESPNTPAAISAQIEALSR